MIRLWRLHWNTFVWWNTRHCRHDLTTQSRLVDSGRRKVYWCSYCEKTWL